MITFNNIVERFEIFAENHFFIKSFSFGSPDDVDLSKFTSFPLMHLVYTGATYDAGTKTYNLEVYILDVPADKNSKELRQKEVVSDAEQCAEDIIADIKNGGNIFLFAQDYEVVNATTTPLEEETKNVLSGVLLDLSVSIPYEWDACNAPINGVEPGGTEITYARRGVLRMLTVDGATDVTSVRTIKVTNGTLTDDGDGVVRLDTGGAEYLSDLQDVSKLTPTAGYALTWSGSEWQPQALPSPPPAPVTSVNTQTGDVSLSLDDLTDVDAGAPTTGQLLAYGQGDWTTISQDEITIGIENVTGLQAELNTIPDGIFDLDDVTQSGGTIAADSYLRYINGVWTNSAPPAPTPVYDELGELLDVTLTSPADNDFLRYNGTVWVNESITQYHNRYQTTAESLRAGATATTELYYTAQADGDGLSESASSDTPTTGYDIRRKLYYAEKAQADPDTSGDWTQFTAIADNTTFNNAKAALLAYLKERTGGTVPISLKMTWEEVAQAPAFTGLLNESYGSGAEAAYSTRRLNGNVTDCMVIRRASDSTTTTIGFDGSGNIDEAAINTFCTGTTCTVVTWKDQSGNGNDATAGSGAEPTIYTGGALVKENGKVAVEFDGSDDYLDGALSITDDFTSLAVAKTTDISTNAKLFLDETNTKGFLYVASSEFNWYDGSTVSKIADADTTQNLFYVSANATNSVVAVDGSDQSVTTINNSGFGSLRIGGRVGNPQYWTGNAQELIFYPSDKRDDRTSIESNIGDYFTQNTPLLDTYSGAAAAYSLRKLSSSYSGSAIRVRRASDNAEQDINFNVFGELDTVSLAAFCGSSDGTIRTWYDQSGNGKNLTQTTAANQPKIYDSVTGVVIRNGKPAIYFSTTNQLKNNLWVSGNVNICDIINVHEMVSSSNGHILFWYDGSFQQMGIQTGNTVLDWSNGTVGEAVDTDQHLVYARANNGSGQIWTDSVAGSVGTTTTTRYFSDRFWINGNGFYGIDSMVEMYQHELVFYTSNQSTSNRTGIESNINTFYSIY